MGKGELGRYCQQKIGWLIPEVWKKWWRKKKKIKKVIKGLQKASKTHAAQAKTLKGVINGSKKGNGKKA